MSATRVRLLVLGLGFAAMTAAAPATAAAVTSAEVRTAISRGVAYLKRQQLEDGSWPALNSVPKGQEIGLTSLATLALLTAGESPDEPKVARALQYLARVNAQQINKTYSVALQTMALAAAAPDRYLDHIAGNAGWLLQAQVRPDVRAKRPAGSWTYDSGQGREDNSNSQYALLGLNAAAESGVRIPAPAWGLARWYWEQGQSEDGGWGYRAGAQAKSTSTMTCAGLSSLALTGSRLSASAERLEGDRALDCGRTVVDPALDRGLTWLTVNFHLGQGQPWRFYYLYGLERAGRLTGQRYLGQHDWYREGAEELVRIQDPVVGCWVGTGAEGNRLVATSFALLFLAKGRTPVLVNKLRHGPGNDWNNDPDDIRNLVAMVSADWRQLLTWQVVSAESSTVEDLLQAPILYLNGHQPPVLGDAGKQALRAFIDQGGFVFAEACCGQPGFDQGFRALVKELFPEPGVALRPLEPEHPVWRARYALWPADHPLWGLDVGCRTVLVYSPGDLSCFWNQRAATPHHPKVGLASRLGQNVVDYATGRQTPADKLTLHEVRDLTRDTPRRGALRIAKLRHGGDWNIAPMAVPNLTSALRKPPLNYDVVIDHYALFPEDPNLVNYPLVYLHGRAALSFTEPQLASLRRHLDPGGGTLFADAACGSAIFDASFRAFAKTLLPDHPLVPIPPGDPIYTRKVGYDLSDCRYTAKAGGGRGSPRLEGIKLNGHWAVIYSPLDIGCALERHSGPECRGYDNASALRIASNIVIYSTLP